MSRTQGARQGTVVVTSKLRFGNSKVLRWTEDSFERRYPKEVTKVLFSFARTGTATDTEEPLFFLTISQERCRRVEVLTFDTASRGPFRRKIVKTDDLSRGRSSVLSLLNMTSLFQWIVYHPYTHLKGSLETLPVPGHGTPRAYSSDPGWLQTEDDEFFVYDPEGRNGSRLRKPLSSNKPNLHNHLFTLPSSLP